MQVKAAKTALFVTLIRNPFPETLIWEKNQKETVSLDLKTMFGRQEKHNFILGWWEIERRGRRGGGKERRSGAWELGKERRGFGNV